MAVIADDKLNFAGRATRKGIASKQIVDALFRHLEVIKVKRAGHALPAWDEIRNTWTAIVLKHLNAYDQKDT